MTEARKGGKKGSKGSKPDWYGDNGSNGKGKGKGKSGTRYCCDFGEQGHIGDEEDDQTSS